ncbi:MAG: ABC transporter permease [Phycisphaerae bacterium]
MALSTIIAYSIIGVVLFIFLLLAYRDLLMLVRRPVRGLGTGISRIWAVGRTTIIESWVARVWMLPIIWLIVSVLLILVVRPYDEADRFPIYIRILLTAQEWMLLLMMWVLACVSLPRERERKIIITNASKPLSRLEILVGKMTGFCVVALGTLAVMGLATWAVLHICDYKIRSDAAKAYQLAEQDYQLHAGTKGVVAPPEEKKRLAEEGSLFAYNYITVPPQNMSILGGYDKANGDRYLKGGSSEKVIYHFPRLVAPTMALVTPIGAPMHPYFEFNFPVLPYVKNPPSKIQIEVTAQRVGTGLSPADARVKEKSVVLDSTGHGYWVIDHPEDLFTAQDDPSKPPESGTDMGPVEVTVSCSTFGVYLGVKDGSPPGAQIDPSQINVVAVPFYNAQFEILPLNNPIMRGFERHDMQEVAGPDKREIREYGDQFIGGAPPLEAAMFRFPAKNLKDIPVDSDGNFEVSLKLDTDKMDNYSVDTEAIVDAYNDNSRQDHTVLEPFPVVEKRITTIKLPAKLLGSGDPSKRGDLILVLTCPTQGHWIALNEDSVRIDQPPSSFFVNVFKSELIIFCEVALLIVICVAWSVRLGWPVAMFASFTCMIFGFIAEFIAALPNAGGLTALGYTHYGERSGIEKFFDAFTEAVWYLLNFIRSLIPDYTRYDSLRFISALRNMPLSTLGSDLLWTIAYAIPFIALGYLLFRKQELG